MENPLIEKQITDYSKNELLKKKYTVNSIDSAPEFQQKTYLSKIIISINLLSLIIGIYILLNQSYYLNQEYNYSRSSILSYFIIIYTLGLFGILILAFLVALLIKLMSFIKKWLKSKKNENEVENILIEDESEDESEDDNFLSQILQNADNISLIPYTFTICVLFTIILYIGGLPISWYLIYTMILNSHYYYIFQFFLLYFFLLVNSISGAIFIFVLIILIKTRRFNSLRKLSFTYDEDNLLTAYKEVKDAINLGK